MKPIRVAGLDPGSDHTGMALLDYQSGDLLDYANVVMLGTNRLQAFAERIVPVLERWAETSDTVLVVEQPPPAYHSEYGHGAQAPIGDALGFLGGLAMGWWAARSLPLLDRVAVGSDKLPGWRQTLCVEASRRCVDLWTPERSSGVPSRRQRATRAKVRRHPAGGFEVPYDGCDHVVTCLTFEAVKNSPPRCPTCAAAPPAEDDGRTRWKRAACRFVAQTWTEVYFDIVYKAKSRSKSIKPDHEYAGVADVCEAACIALHGRYQLNQERFTPASRG